MQPIIKQKQRKQHTRLLKLLFWFIFIIAYLPKITANKDLPDLGNETQAIISSREESLIGKVWLHQLQHAGFISKELVVNTYLQNIGNYLVNKSEQRDLQKFNFFMVENSEINAFAFLGGNVGIFAGLINFTETESELAAIISHEVSHITQKHFARQLCQQKRLTPITIIEAITAAAIGIPDLIVPILGGHMQQMLNFSRSQEQEADHFAVELLSNSKFDPLAMANILAKMDKLNNTEHDKNISKYLLTHPLFKERIFESYARVPQSGYKQYASSLDYQLIKVISHNKLDHNKTDLLIKIEQKLQAKFENYAMAVHNEVPLLFEQAITLQNLHQYSKAKKILTRLALDHPNNLIIQIYLAELLLANEPVLSKQKLENLISIFPDHLPLIIPYVKALIILNEPLKAKKFLNPFNKENLEELLEEPQIYELLIACNQKLKDPGEVLLLQAKLLFINNQLDAAEQKINLALNKIKDRQNNMKNNNHHQSQNHSDNHKDRQNQDLYKNSNFNKLNKFQKQLKQYKETLTSIKL